MHRGCHVKDGLEVRTASVVTLIGTTQQMVVKDILDGDKVQCVWFGFDAGRNEFVFPSDMLERVSW